MKIAELKSLSTRIRLAHAQGMQAAKNGEHVTSCPHDHKTAPAEYQAWRAGWYRDEQSLEPYYVLRAHA